MLDAIQMHYLVIIDICFVFQSKTFYTLQENNGSIGDNNLPSVSPLADCGSNPNGKGLII